MSESDLITRIEINYHHNRKIKTNEVLEKEGIDYVTYDYKEQIIIDRESETLTQTREMGSGCKITNTYYVEDGFSALLDCYSLDDFEEIIGNPSDVVNNPLDSEEYTLKIQTEKGTELTVNGTYDKYGLPTYWSDFMEDVIDFISFYGIGEVFNRRNYEKVKRRESDLIFCNVEFPDGYKTYCYLADTDDYAPGDFVVVPAGWDNYEAIVRIESIEYHSEEDAPYPIDKIKHIIRKCEFNDEDED